jgi:hypothetical protein
MSLFRSLTCCFLLALPAVAHAQATPAEGSITMCGGDYQLHFTVPNGWNWDEDTLFEEARPHYSLQIGCYVPHHSASYSDFHDRMAEEVEFMRRRYGRARVRHLHVGSLAAVEVRSPYGKRPDSEYLQNIHRRSCLHERSRVVHDHLATTSHRAALARAYRDLLRSCRVTRDDGDSVK